MGEHHNTWNGEEGTQGPSCGPSFPGSWVTAAPSSEALLGGSLALQGPFPPASHLPSPGDLATPEPEAPVYQPQQVQNVKDFLLNHFDPNFSDLYDHKAKMSAARLLYPTMVPRLQTVNPNINQPVTFIFQNIQIAAQERQQFDLEQKRLRRDFKNGNVVDHAT